MVREPVAQRRPEPTHQGRRVARVVRRQLRAQIAHARFAAAQHRAERHRLHLTQGIEGREPERREHAQEAALAEVVPMMGIHVHRRRRGDGRDEHAARPQHRRESGEEAAGILEVLERLERDDRIKALGVPERERVGDPELDARAAIARSRVVDGGVAAIDAEHRAHVRAAVREQPGPVPDTAGDIEHAAGREAARREFVAFEMQAQGRASGDVVRLERIRNEALEAVRGERHRGKPIRRGTAP